MTGRKKREPPMELDMPFEEAMTRFVQTDPKEIADAYQRVRARQEEVRENVESRKRIIQNAGRPKGKPVRI